MSGLEVVGRERYGVMPLRGKMLNVRTASLKQIVENEEIVNLCLALGLDFNKGKRSLTPLEVGEDKNGENGEKMRYGKVMIMADQDHDGSHIKGLLINFFHHFWPDLAKKPGFLGQFITPLIKVIPKRGNPSLGGHDFFSGGQFDDWLVENKDSLSKYNIKYYKGLGTSTSKEGREYFSNLPFHQRDFDWIDSKNKHEKEGENVEEEGFNEGELIDLVFSKHRAEERKKWILSTYQPDSYLDLNSITNVTMKDFFNKEMIHFSNADNIRSIPSVVDGLKPSQRKVLFGCFKRNLRGEMKVAQLSGL